MPGATPASHVSKRNTSTPNWLTLILLSLCTAAALQQSNPQQSTVRNDDSDPGQESSVGKSSRSNRLQGSFLDSIQRPFKSTDREPTRYTSNERAIATWAPTAPFNPVVRAPPAVTTGLSGGLTSRHLARSMQDWEVEDFVLLATVDGAVYATDRNDGTVRWTFQVDRPMVETIYHERNKSRLGIDGEPDGGSASVDDFLWIVEPSQDGNIYIYRPGADMGLQSLGMTVRQLAEEYAPYASEYPSVVYTAEKKNVLFTLDATNGAILQNFRLGGSSAGDDRSCRRATGLQAAEDEECQVLRTLTLARTDYAIAIQSRTTGEPICTIKYFEWTMNKKDKDLQSQHLRSKDNRYIYNSFDGSIAALDHERGPKSERPVYTQKFSAPVVQIFDVAGLSDDSSTQTPLIVLPQPARPLMDADSDSVFVNCTESGSWYALSEDSYPLVTSGASRAQCYSRRWPNSMVDWQSANLAQQRSAFVGVHSLGLHQPEQQSLLALPGPTEPMQVSEASSLPDPIFDNADVPLVDPPAATAASFPYYLTLGAIFLAFLYFFSFYFRKAISGQLRDVDSRLRLADSAKRLEERERYEANIIGGAEDDQVPVLDGRKVVRFAGISEPSAGSSAPEAVINKDSPSQVIPTLMTEIDALGEVEPTIPVVALNAGEALTENITVPVLDGAEALTENITVPVLDGAEEAPSPPSKPKKKAHRGQRGGRKLKKARSGSKEEENENVDEMLAEDSIVMNTAVLAELDSLSADHSLANNITKTRLDINNLVIYTDRIRGSGSGGTFVFEGEFEGRDVAVKRMLPQFYEMKNQEVSLLRHSEDHDNVIRYYCERTDANFLYIALELCQASLWDLFKDGESKKDLRADWQAFVTDILSNGQRMLYQLAAGLNHLHSLRIIHRDIKPQNILIAYPKKRNKLVGVRLVISDFGLCKTLPDNASTLIGVTGNAGTQGWKAPELILHSKEDDNSQHSHGSNGVSTGSLNGDTAGSQGVKRAVDIFSLGCVFFYIVTGGWHPYEDKEGYLGLRERNIKRNKPDLSRLSDLSGNDAEEALDLIRWMLEHRPEYRPTAEEVMRHPFFWSTEKRLNFLCEVSDHWEHECRDPPSSNLQKLELASKAVFGDASGKLDFLSKLDKKFLDTLGKQRKYNADKMLDLLRALRNKKNHYADMPLDVQQKVGPLPEGYLRYWMSRFPALLRMCYHVVMECKLEDEPRFRPFYQQRNDWLLEL